MTIPDTLRHVQTPPDMRGPLRVSPCGKSAVGDAPDMRGPLPLQMFA